MILVITIQRDNGQRVDRRYDWDNDCSFEEKGKAIEDMIATIKEVEN